MYFKAQSKILIFYHIKESLQKQLIHDVYKLMIGGRKKTQRPTRANFCLFSAIPYHFFQYPVPSDT